MRPVTLCIINFNGADHLRRAFEAIRTQTWHFSEIMVVDNASTDDSLDTAATLCPSARLVRLDRNGGPGAARNAGFAAAVTDLVLFQDNDVCLQADTVAALLDELNTDAATLAVAPRVLYADEPTRVQFDSADCHFLGLMATRNADVALADLDDVAAETTSLVTACFLIDRARWHGGQPFDDTLGFNLEDHDFAVRACLAGHRLRVAPRARVLHGAGTPGLSYRPGVEPPADRQFFLTRNRWLLIAKCFSSRTLLVLAPALVIFELLQLLWFVGRRRTRVWLRAVVSFWSLRNSVWSARATIQRDRHAPDSAVLRDAPLPVTRHVTEHSNAAQRLIPLTDRALRAYWRGARGWIR